MTYICNKRYKEHDVTNLSPFPPKKKASNSILTPLSKLLINQIVKHLHENNFTEVYFNSWCLLKGSLPNAHVLAMYDRAQKKSD